MNVTHHVSKTKFSISQIRNERKSVFKVDRRYEFSAPKFYDFSHTVEETLDENWIDPWFSIDHDRSTLILNDIHEKKDKPEMKRELPRGNKGNLPQNDTKKRNYAQFHSSWKGYDEAEEPRNVYLKQKKKSSSRQIATVLRQIDNYKGNQNKSHLSKDSSCIDESKEKKFFVTNSKQSLKRFLPSDKHINRFEENLKTRPKTSFIRKNQSVSLRSSSNLITYCPRIHDMKILRKWELITNKKWYDLSPMSRHKANSEITQMLKDNLL